MAIDPPETLVRSQSTSPDRRRQAQPVGPGLRAPGLHVGEHLGGERLVDLHQSQLLQVSSGALQRLGHREDRPHQSCQPGSTALTA